MNVNKTIHEAMGLCWHDWEVVKESIYGSRHCHCLKCDTRWTLMTTTPQGDFPDPDYTAPVHYCALVDWMRKNDLWWELEVWLKVVAILDRKKSYELREFLRREVKEQITLIAEAIAAGVLK